jgi:hypothetical protein
MDFLWKILHLLSTKKSIVLILLLILLFTIIKNPQFEYEAVSYLNKESLFENEWVVVANRVIIRLKSIFYMTNNSLLIFSVFTEKENIQDISFKIILRESTIFRTNKQISLIKVSEYVNRYALYQIRSSLSISPDENMKLYVSYRNYSSKPLDILVKTKKSNTNSIYLCSKFYNTFLKYDHFKLWIQMNKKLNYSKIIVYNNSILNDDKFKRLFYENKILIELKPYVYLPYFNPNTSALEFYDYSKRKNNIGTVLYLHERIAINECYLNNAYNTEFIAVMDSDEILLANNENCSTLDLYQEIKKIRNTMKRELSSISYWFSYKLYISPEYEKVFIRALNLSLINRTVFKNELKIVTDKFPGTNKQTEVLISNVEDFKYAKKLLEFYEENLINKAKTSNPFEYLFLLQNEYQRQYGWGKSVHETQDLIAFGHHEAISAKNRIEVNYKHGYIGHFRQIANYLPNRTNVKSFQVDFNFYKCFWNKNT